MTAGGGAAPGDDEPRAGEPPAGSPPTRRIGPYEQSLRESAQRIEATARRRARAVRRRTAVLVVGLVVAGAAAGYGGWLLLRPEPAPTAAPTAVATAGSCADPVALVVAAPPAVAPALDSVTTALRARRDGPCAVFTIQPVDAYAVAGAIGAVGAPDAWVTDSLAWLDRAKVVSGRALTAREPFASSGVVVALSRPAAEEIGGRAPWSTILSGSTPIRLPDPTRSAVGASVLGSIAPTLTPEALTTAIRSSAVSPQLDLPAVAASKTPVGLPVLAAQLAAHNESHPDQELAGLAPTEAVPFVADRLVTVTTDATRARLIDALGRYLDSEEAREILTEAGFKTPGSADPRPPTPLFGMVRDGPAATPAVAKQVSDAWRASTPRTQALLAVDVSGEMLDRTDAGSRIAVAQSAVARAASGMVPTSRLALWTYSLHIGARGYDFKAAVPAADVGLPAQLRAVETALGSLHRSVGGGRGLYDTVAAAYDEALRTFRAGFANTVVVVSSGGNQDDYGLSATQLLEHIRAARDPRKPVRIVVVAIGLPADEQNLRTVVSLTGGSYLPAPKAADLLPALRTALGG